MASRHGTQTTTTNAAPTPQHDPIEREGLSDLAKAVDDGVIDRAAFDRRKSPGEVGDQPMEAKPAF